MQSRAVSRMIEHELTAAEPGLVLTVVLAETLWVRGDMHSATESEKIDCAEQLLTTRQFKSAAQAGGSARSAGGAARIMRIG